MVHSRHWLVVRPQSHNLFKQGTAKLYEAFLGCAQASVKPIHSDCWMQVRRGSLSPSSSYRFQTVNLRPLQLLMTTAVSSLSKFNSTIMLVASA